MRQKCVILSKLLAAGADQTQTRRQAGMTLVEMVVTLGLFSLMMAGLASFVSFMEQSHQKINQQITKLSLQREITNLLSSSHSWNNSKAASVNQDSFACLRDRSQACKGTLTVDQKYYRFSLFDSAEINSQAIFPSSPTSSTIGLGGFTKDGKVCVHNLADRQEQKSDSCPYFIEIGWRFHCDLPCLTDSVEVKANLKYSPRTLSASSKSSAPVAVVSTFREPQALNSQLTNWSAQPAYFLSTFFPGCKFASAIISVPVKVSEFTAVLVSGYGKSHLYGGSYSSALANPKIRVSSGINIYLDPGCADCPNPSSIPNVYQQPLQKPSVDNKSAFLTETVSEMFSHCGNSSCGVNFSVDPSGVFNLEPGAHTIFLKHTFWHCEGVVFYGSLDSTQLRLSFIY